MIMTLQVKDTAIVAVNNPLSVNLVADWLKYNADKSDATIRTYSKAVGYFFQWLADNDIAAPQREHVISYRRHLCATKRISTARLYITSLKIFSKWLSSKGLYADFASNVKAPALAEEGEGHSREALTLEEARQVLSSLKGKQSEKDLRDELIMRLMLNCGLRSIEIVRLDANDIEKRHGKIFLKIWGKGRAGKNQRVEISKVIYNMILDYLNARGSKMKVGEPLFVSTANRNRGQRLQTQSISKLAKKVFRSVGIDSPSIVCHSCRHFAITQLLLEGVDIEKCRLLARHKSIVTTTLYRHDISAANNDAVGILSNLLDNMVA